MELAIGPLPSRPPAAAPTERQADPWGDFLRRVLVSVGLPEEPGGAGIEPPLSAALLPPSAPSSALNTSLAAE